MAELKSDSQEREHRKMRLLLPNFIFMHDKTEGLTGKCLSYGHSQFGHKQRLDFRPSVLWVVCRLRLSSTKNTKVNSAVELSRTLKPGSLP